MPSFGKQFQYMKKPTSLTILVLLLISFVIVFTIFSQSNGLHQNLLKTSTDLDNAFPKSWVDYTLSQAASKIAQNNTLIVCTVSEPFLPLLNNWLISISRQNHLNSVLVIAEDNTTLFEVNKNWPGHAVLLSPPLTSSQLAYNFNSEGFYKLTSRRPQHLLNILELGYNVMYNDVDMVWLADPFPYMKEGYDVFITDDYTVERPLNHSHDWPKEDSKINICSCMIYMRPTNGAKLLMKKWIEEIKIKTWSKENSTNDQPAFNIALSKTYSIIKVYLLPQTGFPSGFLYFMDRNWAKKYKGMQAIIHSNYIVGMKTKIQYLKARNFWFVDHHLSESPLVKRY